MKKCEHVWRVKVNLFIDIPIDKARRINKKALRSKAIRIEAAGWPTARTYCANCGKPGPVV